MNNIKNLRELFGYTEENFAKLFHTSEINLLSWENFGELPHYQTLKYMSEVFGVPIDYIEGSGIFENWDEVLKYYQAVSYEFQDMLPCTFKMPYFDNHKLIDAWIDTRMYHPHEELQIIRWFAFAVSNIKITPPEDNAQGPEVNIEFTEEFNAIIDYHLANPPRKQSYSAAELFTGYIFELLNPEGQKKAADYIRDLIDSGQYSHSKGQVEKQA